MSFKKLEVNRSKIFDNVYVFKPSSYIDLRGLIFTAYQEGLYSKYINLDVPFVHDKFTISKKNVLRGLHGDSKTWKLVTCIQGEIFQVIVDYRPESPTYLKWESWILNDKNKLQILVPPNFLNGFCVLSNKSIYYYKLAYRDEYFDVQNQITVKWNEPKIGIKWPISDPILQERDK